MMNRNNQASVTLSLLGLTVALIVGWAVTANADDPQTLNGWTIESGPIKTTNSTTPPKTKRVKGSFELETVENPAGTRRAGACLIADLTSQGVGLASCTSHQQCNDAYNAAPHPKLGSGIPGPYLYCLGDSADAVQKHCWIRPGPDSSHCSKNLFAPGEHAVPAEAPGNTEASSVAADPLGNGKPVTWGVYGCLNPDNNLPPACLNTASTAKVNSLGKLKKVQP
jgi:hypothetical protein